MFKNYPMIPRLQDSIIKKARETWEVPDLQKKLEDINSEQHTRDVFGRAIKSSITGDLHNRLQKQIKNHNFNTEYMYEDPGILWLELVSMCVPAYDTLVNSHKKNIENMTMKEAGGHPLLLLQAYEADFLILDACSEKYPVARQHIYTQLQDVDNKNQVYFHRLHAWHDDWEKNVDKQDCLQAIQNFEKTLKTMIRNKELDSVDTHKQTQAHLAQTKRNQSQKARHPNTVTDTSSTSSVPRNVNTGRTTTGWGSGSVSGSTSWNNTTPTTTWGSWTAKRPEEPDNISTSSAQPSTQGHGYAGQTLLQQTDTSQERGRGKRFVDPPFKFTKPDNPNQTHIFDNRVWFYCEKCGHFATHMTIQHIDDYRQRRQNNRGGGRGGGRGGRGYNQPGSYYGPGQQDQHPQQQAPQTFQQQQPIQGINPDTAQLFQQLLLGLQTSAQGQNPQGQQQGGHLQHNYNRGQNNYGPGST